MAERSGFSDDIPIFRPHIGGRRGQIRGGAVPSFRSALVVGVERATRRRAQTIAITRPPRNVAAVRDVRQPDRSARRCLIKARYVRMSASGAFAARLHLKYIERDGVEPDGSKGRLFDAKGDSDLETFLAPIAKEPHQFRFIVSPEDADKLDLRDFTRCLMAQMEEDLARKLLWAAVCHHDTDNAHVHVVLRGADAAGKALIIDPKYLSDGFRHRAQQIATKELGPRIEWDMQRQFAKEVTQERFTSLDRKIEPLLDAAGSVDLGSLQGVGPGMKSHLVGRLGFLERLHLASQTSPASWELAAGWRESLIGLGQRGDIIKRLHASMKRPPAQLRIFDEEASSRIEGIVRKKGLHNELGEDLYAVVETARGEAHYVRLAREHAEEVQEGDHVRVHVKAERWLKESDRAIAAVAERHHGFYDPASHRRELAAAPVFAAGRLVPADDVVAVNLRRLERLGRYRMVSQLPDGRWRIPGNLIEQLGERERSQPRSRVHVDRSPMPIEKQVTHPGPTWLDTCDREGHAQHGFGAELSAALARRADFIRARNLNPGDPELVRKLAELRRERDIGPDRELSLGWPGGMRR